MSLEYVPGTTRRGWSWVCLCHLHLPREGELLNPQLSPFQTLFTTSAGSQCHLPSMAAKPSIMTWVTSLHLASTFLFLLNHMQHTLGLTLLTSVLPPLPFGNAFSQLKYPSCPAAPNSSVRGNLTHYSGTSSCVELFLVRLCQQKAFLS